MVQRHGFSVLFVHWAVALSTIALIFSGFGQMPMYKRYRIADLPGLGWSADYSVTIVIHYLAAVLFLLAVAYHIVFHLVRKDFDILPRRGDFRQSLAVIRAMIFGGEEPPSDKYVAEQRLAYAFVGSMIILISVTGILKVIKNLPSVSFSGTFVIWVNDIHTFASILLIFGIAAHLAAFLFKANRPLIRGMFTGRVDLEYARRRHSLWYKRLLAGEERKTPPADLAAESAAGELLRKGDDCRCPGS
ncbi:MAG: cytochrome b/b6 domain-containing protein [Peptococcaceae bacterium]|nr:cytochrome b/b6 domain-containing protein [Peptococcaceae bacterium]